MLRLLLMETRSGAIMSNSPFRVAWDAFKVSGNLEYSGGDILVVVKINFPNGGELIGCAFLEAKRIYANGTYQELCSVQLNRQMVSHPAHMLLLYDHQTQATLSNFCGCYLCELRDIPGLHSSNVIAVPAAHAVALASKGRGISSYGYSFLDQLCMRYFRGLDLDFDKVRVGSVISRLPEIVKYVLAANIQMGPGDSVPSTEFVSELLGRGLEQLPE